MVSPDQPRRRRTTRAESGKGLRLFVAIYPPGGVAAQMLQAARLHLHEHATRYEGAAAQFVAPEQIHLTPHFIGNVPARGLAETIETIDRAKKGLHAFSLIPGAIIALPPGARHKPRLIAIETDAPADLLELQRRLAQRFARPARERPGDRFLPHFTLARFRWSGGGERLEHPAWRGPLDDAVEPESFQVGEFHLVKSILHPDGARHQSVTKWPLVAR